MFVDVSLRGVSMCSVLRLLGVFVLVCKDMCK